MSFEENENGPTQKEIEIKYKAPSRLDAAPYGQIWKVIGEKDSVSVWLQVSKVEGESNWIEISAFFDKDVKEAMEHSDK